MTHTKFVISTVEKEKEIVGMIRKDIEFFKTHKIRFTWPKKKVEEEYNIKKYKDYKEWLENEWLKKENGFTERLLTFFNKPTKLQFIIEISNYGPLGFYNPNNNTITINQNTHLDAARTIKHEMIHILVEPFIKKYHIQHKKKEHIINTIFEFLG